MDTPEDNEGHAVHTVYQKIMHHRSGNKAKPQSAEHYSQINECHGVHYPAYTTVAMTAVCGFANNLHILIAKTESFADYFFPPDII